MRAKFCSLLSCLEKDCEENDHFAEPEILEMLKCDTLLNICSNITDCQVATKKRLNIQAVVEDFPQKELASSLIQKTGAIGPVEESSGRKI